MATENAPFKLLVPSGNQALPTLATNVTAILGGQIGVYNIHSGLAVSAASPAPDLEDIFIAVGIGTDTVQATDIRRSAGQHIQVRNLKTGTLRGTVDSVAKVIEISNFTTKCETDYSIKIEFRGQKSYVMNGYQPFVKTFSAFTAACSDQCVGCGDGDGMDLAQELVANINADTDALAVASLYANKITATVAAEPSATGDIVVTIGTTAYTVAIVDADTVTTAAAKIVAVINTQADSPYRATNLLGVISIYPTGKTVVGITDTLVYTTPLAGLTITPIVAATKTAISNSATFQTSYPGVYPLIRITAAPATVDSLASSTINMNYLSSADMDIVVTPVSGFENNSTTATITQIQYGEGDGEHLKMLENIQQGWGKGGPYRMSDTLGTVRGGRDASRITTTSKYTTLSFTYDFFSVGGWGEFLNNLETIIAIPCADTTTLTGLIAVLDAAFAACGRHIILANDAAANSGIDCSNVQTSALAAATDGIEILA